MGVELICTPFKLFENASYFLPPLEKFSNSLFLSHAVEEHLCNSKTYFSVNKYSYYVSYCIMFVIKTTW